MKYKAVAKLNLFLHITGQNNNKYHELQTLFQLIDYCDELSFELRTDNKINLDCNIDIPMSSNLVAKAARLLQWHCQVAQGVDIYLHKRIALGAGLGGGSSDAAITLQVLNELWDCQLDDQQLMTYGKDLGADVPLFIAGRSAWAEGIGDILQAVDLPPRWYVVFVPSCQVDTRSMFADPNLKRNCTPVSLKDYLAGGTCNVFEAVIRNRYPQITADMDWLNSLSRAYLTGSGGAFFAICESKQQALELSANHPPHLQFFIARGINKSSIMMRSK